MLPRESGIIRKLLNKQLLYYYNINDSLSRGDSVNLLLISNKKESILVKKGYYLEIGTFFRILSKINLVSIPSASAS